MILVERLNPLGYKFIWVWYMEIDRLACKYSLNNMEFHFFISCPGSIFLCQQPWVLVPRELGSCPQTGFLSWFGTVNMRTQRQVTARLRIREVPKPSQGSHTCNRTALHPVVKHPAVRSWQMMVFRVGHINSGHGPLTLREVLYTPLQGPPGEKKHWSARIKCQLQSTECFHAVFCGYYNTAGGGD